MQTRPLTFEGASGVNLSARLEMPADDDPIAYALFAHCFTCSKNYKAVVNISRALAQAHIAVLRFDFTGLGDSEGEFSDTTFSSNVEDLVAAAEFLEREYAGPEILIGHSLGGAAVLQAAARVSSSKAVVTINAPAEPQDVKRHLTGSLEEIEHRGAAEVELGGRPFTITRKFLEDLDEQNMAEVIRSLDRALLVFHSPDDPIVSIDNAQRIYATSAGPKNFFSLAGADHLLSRSEDSEYVGTVVATWARRYLAPPPETDKPEPQPNQAVARTGRARFPTEIFAGGHALVADEPLDNGGTDAGPTPWGLLMASLGACTTITLRMYADRKEWPLEEIAVRLERRTLDRAAQPSAPSGTPRSVEIRQALELFGPLDEEQRDRLLEIAQRCPVHRALTAGLVLPMELSASSES